MPDKKYTVDEIIFNSGHIPLRLPPHHCHLNPIKLVWHQMKKFIRNYNLGNNRKF